MSIASWKSLIAFVALAVMSITAASAQETTYHYATVEGMRIFYREAGDPSKPTILLLHGFPSSSHMFRDLMPKLSSRFHLVAPDYPGFGFSDAPPADKLTATFDSVSLVTEKFAQQMSLTHVIVYEQDFGGPIGMRISLRHPDWIAGLIIQNSPISTDGWDQARLKAVLANAGPVTPEKRAAVEARVVPTTAEYLYKHGARHPEALNPDAWANDGFAMSKPENRRIMTDMQLDISSNVDQYPLWQTYLREHQPKTLVLWGRGDAVFAPDGAEAVKRVVPSAEIHYYETGHFALEEDSTDIAMQIIRKFAP